MHRWTILTAAAVLVCGLAAPPAALADLVVVAKDQETTGYSLVANDTSTEDNRIEVSFDAATARWLISDEAGVIEAATECLPLSPTSVGCLAAPFNIVKIETERGADVVRAVGKYAAIGPASGRYVDLAVGLGRGRDTFRGAGGDNVVVGGRGHDRLIGGGEFDRLFGGPGADRLVGGRGAELLVGGAGNDRLSTGSGSRGLMIGGRGKDRCVAGRPRHRVGGCERVAIK